MLNEHDDKQKMCEEKIFQLQSMQNAKISVDQRFAVKNSGTSCLALIFDLNNTKMNIQQANTQSKVTRLFYQYRYDKSYTIILEQIEMNSVEARSSEMGLIPAAF